MHAHVDSRESHRHAGVRAHELRELDVGGGGDDDDDGGVPEGEERGADDHPPTAPLAPERTAAGLEALHSAQLTATRSR